ncbi:MAG: RluA family pseudouridine synthase [Lachnospiraceae bacterium]|nr:RluA family pseudouridine synthase [Lachnospiraceae bacterium]
MVKRILEYKISTEYIGKRVDKFLEGQGYPKQAVTNLRKNPGLLKVNGETVFMNYRFAGEDNLTVVIEEEETEASFNAVDLSIKVIYEDSDIIVLEKSAGMPIHPSINNYDNTLANALAFYFMQKNEAFVFRCINRLDKDTSGLTIIAKHYLAAGILSDEMRERRIKREYTAIVEGCDIPDEGTIDMPIARVSESVITREVNYEKGDNAITHFRVVKKDELRNISMVKLVLETGRTHQIRVHMKAIGHPLCGDYIYNPNNHLMNRQALHAGKIEFIHPITKQFMSFETEIPEDMTWF